MTSELDLRIKYKLDTGYAPTYGRVTYYGKKSKFEHDCNYEGALTNEYAQWLENLKQVNHYDVRLAYKFDTGLEGAYDSYYYGYYNWKIIRTKDYKKWLENRICEDKPITM
ncbi:hypothetical protein M0Q50_06510 [bacterium]|jgi:hypothetical protein|nr:hypothetical protein [bacterium]